MKIGIYGGTFDPPHGGHMAAAGAAMEYLGLDRLFLIPAKLPPHKQMPEDAASPAHRFAMTALMADGLGSKAEVLDVELKRPGKSFTADTIEVLRKQYPEDEFWLLMGTDMFLSLQDWYHPELLFREVRIAPFARTEENWEARFAAQSKWLEEQYGATIRIVPLPKINEISSTHLRDMLSGEGEKTDELLWLPVYGYILRHGLYGTHADLKHLTDQQLRAVSYSMVKAKRLPHIRGTEETAVKLAKHWGENPELARRAAILHDCTKYLNLEEQLHLCEKYGIFLDDMEQKGVKFLHSKTGAALAQHMFGEPEPEYEAIYCHTTGKPNMKTLDKILYLADYMEPNRKFEGVETLRKLVWEDLDKAMVLGLEMTIEELGEKNAPVHRNTLLTLKQLKGRIQ